MDIFRALKKVSLLRRGGAYQEALDILHPLFNRSVEAGAVDPDLARSLAEIFCLAGHFEQGRSVYYQAISCKPSDTLLIGRYAEYLAFSGDIDNGLSFIDKARQKAPQDDALALSKTIILHRYRKDLDAAAAFVQNYLNAKQGFLDVPELMEEARAVFHRVERRDMPRSKGTVGGIWDSMGARQAINTDSGRAAAYSGLKA